MDLANIDPIMRVAVFVVGAVCLLSPALVFFRTHALHWTAGAIVIPGTVLCSAGAWKSVKIEMPGGYKAELAELKDVVRETNMEVVSVSTKLNEYQSGNLLAVAEVRQRVQEQLLEALTTTIPTDNNSAQAAAEWSQIFSEATPFVPEIEKLTSGEPVVSNISGTVRSVKKNEDQDTYSIIILGESGENEAFSNIADTELSVGDIVAAKARIGTAVSDESQQQSIRLTIPDQHSTFPLIAGGMDTQEGLARSQLPNYR